MTGPLRGAAAGSRADLLGLALGCLALTVATAGLYSFWARTRLRERVWASVSLGGAPFEYTGRPAEKLMGFSIAAVIVGCYLGLGVMLLIFLSLQLTAGTEWGTAAAFALLLPVWAFAQYRGLRYLLSRTRWRGLAFSLRPGAWGYAWRGTLWTLAALVSAGLLWPLRARALFGYRASRVRWGDASLAWRAPPVGALYRAWAPVAVLGAAAAASVASGLPFLALPLALAAVAAWVAWRAVSFRLLMSGLSIGEGRVAAAPRTARLIRIQLGGWAAVLVALAVAAFGALFAFGAGLATMAAQVDSLQDLPVWTLVALAFVLYVAVFLLRGALRLALVTFPTIAHVAETTILSDPRAPDAVRRGRGDGIADADGFANLFDFGSAI